MLEEGDAPDEVEGHDDAILYYTILHYTTLYYTILHYTMHQMKSKTTTMPAKRQKLETAGIAEKAPVYIYIYIYIYHPYYIYSLRGSFLVSVAMLYVSIGMCIHAYMYTCMCVYIYIYIYILYTYIYTCALFGAEGESRACGQRRGEHGLGWLLLLCY